MTAERPPTTGRRVLVVAGASLVLAAAGLLFALLCGATAIDPREVLTFRADAVAVRKVFGFRLPRALVAEIVGAALATAGLVFQALIRNPLASPYVLGVSAGGSLGAVAALSLGWAFPGPAAFAGCVLAIAVVYAVARSGGRFPATTLLLSGVVVNAFFSAAIMFVNLVAAPRDQDRILRWLVGGLRDFYDGADLAGAAVATLLATVVLFRYARELNLLSLSDGAAERAGVAVPRVRRTLFLVASLLTATAVTVSGPIGFVGLIVPHVARLVVGPDHRVLVPCCAFLGAGFLAAVDATAQAAWTTPLPAGVVTAFLGGPLFLVLLKRRDRARAGLDG
ncbi:MAG TPA: iron ABC transporter permease [Planctomycetota bacterium]|nr:iron ABC transporter permease [Planctomycetota bacterium]